MKMSTYNLKWLILLLGGAVACLSMLIALIHIQQSDLFDRITGFELTRNGSDIVVSWDEMDCNSYEVTVEDGLDESYMITTDKNKYVIKDAYPNTKYTVTLTAVYDYNRFSDAERLTIKTGKQ